MFGNRTLDGNWEEKYGYYVELSKGSITVRDHSKKIVAQTGAKLKRGTNGRIDVVPKDSGLSYEPGRNYATFEMYYLDGEMHFEVDYPISGLHSCILEKTDIGPFGNIIILDGKRPDLHGDWEEVDAEGSKRYLRLAKDKLTVYYGEENDKTPIFESDIHYVNYKTEPGRLYIVNGDLTRSDFGAFTRFELIGEGLLMTHAIVLDAPFVPKYVFKKV